MLRRTIEYVIYVTVATLVVPQVELIAPLAGWEPRLIRIIGVIFLSRVAVEVASLFVQEALISRARLSADEKQRRQTIVPLIHSIIRPDHQRDQLSQAVHLRRRGSRRGL